MLPWASGPSVVVCCVKSLEDELWLEGVVLLLLVAVPLWGFSSVFTLKPDSAVVLLLGAVAAAVLSSAAPGLVSVRL